MLFRFQQNMIVIRLCHTVIITMYLQIPGIKTIILIVNIQLYGKPVNMSFSSVIQYITFYIISPTRTPRTLLLKRQCIGNIVYNTPHTNVSCLRSIYIIGL